jgi:hypothetical protein
MPRSTTNSSSTSYTNLGNNIYQVTNSNGNRYRVRVSIQGTQYDQYFTNKSKAMKFRNELLRQRKAA